MKPITAKRNLRKYIRKKFHTLNDLLTQLEQGGFTDVTASRIADETTGRRIYIGRWTPEEKASHPVQFLPDREAPRAAHGDPRGRVPYVGKVRRK